jgi:transcription factor E
MYISLLKEIVGSILGPQGVFIAEMLYGKKNVNEFAIAKKLKLTINQTRNMLYRLSDEGLVSFIRKKDTKKGGWYTYFWTLSLEKSLAKFREKLQKDMQQLEQSIQNKKTIRYFKCNACGNELTEDQALLHDYHCSECGELMQPKDTNPEIQEINLKVDKLKQVLTKVESELSAVQAEEGKKKVRKFKAELKKKQVERAAKRKLREKEKKKLANKGKKKSKGRK